MRPTYSLPLLLVCTCSLLLVTVVVGQTPYSQYGDSATQYQHRWTDELEFAAIHQQQPQQPSRAGFTTQQSANTPAANEIADALQPHLFTPIAATTTGTQHAPSLHHVTTPSVTIPLANVLARPLAPSDSDFDTAATDTQDEAFDTHGFPFNETVRRRARAVCALSCDERVLDVTGEGRVMINSSRALIRATIQYKEQLKAALLASSATSATLHALLLSASNQTAATAAIVIGYLQSHELTGRIWQLHTTSVLVEPLYQYVNGTQLTDGYRASLSLSLQATTANASAILTGILERGVTRIDSVGYEAADADTAKARQTAVKRAVKDALQQATTAVQGVQQSLHMPTDEHERESTSGLELQVISMRVTGLSMPSALVIYPQTRIFGLSRSTSALFVDEAVMSIPVIAEEKVVTATVMMKIRF